MATKSKYEENYTTVYEATVNQVAKDRHEIANLSFPELREEDFPPAIDGKNPYKDALVAQYLAIREYEYNLVVQNESMKAFNVSYGCNQKKGRRCENNQSWNGYPQSTVDSCFIRTNEIAIKSKGLVPGGNSCAISSTSLTAQISGKMGYDGDENLIRPKPRFIHKNNPGVASDINQLDSIPEDFRISYNVNNRKAPTLNQAIKQGMIKVGNEFAIQTGQPTENSSGCHAMVLVDIQYAADGKTVLSYTLQGNNPPTLKQVDASAPDYYGARKLVCVTKTNEWIKDQDSNKIQKMSEEELKKAITKARQGISATIDEMQAVEADYVKNKRYANAKVNIGHTNGFGAHYNETALDLHQKAEILHAENQLRKLEQENAEREASLKQREAEIAEQEAKYEQDKTEFLHYHPNQEQVLAEKDKERAENSGISENPEAVEVPPVTDSKDLEERIRNANARKEALDKKEAELVDRAFNVGARDMDLVLLRQDPVLIEEEKEIKKEEEKAAEKARKEAEKAAKKAAKAQKRGAEQQDTPEDPAIQRIETHGAMRGDHTDAAIDIHNNKAALQNPPTQERTSETPQPEVDEKAAKEAKKKAEAEAKKKAAEERAWEKVKWEKEKAKAKADKKAAKQKAKAEKTAQRAQQAASQDAAVNTLVDLMIRNK